jgi:hypothetical protein
LGLRIDGLFVLRTLLIRWWVVGRPWKSFSVRSRRRESRELGRLSLVPQSFLKIDNLPKSISNRPMVLQKSVRSITGAMFLLAQIDF